MGSIDYNTNGLDINGHTGDVHGKGILRASSELPTGRQNRDQDRKARTPDLNNESKEDKKKRGKSPFKLVLLSNHSQSRHDVHLFL